MVGSNVNGKILTVPVSLKASGTSNLTQLEPSLVLCSHTLPQIESENANPCKSSCNTSLSPIEELRHFRTSLTSEQVLNDLRYANLDGTNAEELKRIRIRAEAIRAFSQLAVPDILSHNSSRIEALTSLKDLKQIIPEIPTLIQQAKLENPKSETAKCLNALFVDLIVNLQMRHIEKLSTHLMISDINRTCRKLMLYQKFGLAFVDEVNFKLKTPKRWSENCLKEAESALNSVPAWITLWTPLMGIVQRTATDPKMPLMFGYRSNNGDIRICDSGVKSGFSSLFLHEIGHGLHFGSQRTLETDAAGFVTASGDPLFDFPAFSRISNWQIVQQKYKLDIDSNVIKLNGRTIPLRMTVQEEDGLSMYTYDIYSPRGARLWRLKPLSGFAPYPNALASPWEDWADGFSFYFTDKSNFKLIAPDKFNYFDSFFGH